MSEQKFELNLNELAEMFPQVDREVCRLILENMHNELGPAIDQLLALSGDETATADSTRNSFPVPPGFSNTTQSNSITDQIGSYDSSLMQTVYFSQSTTIQQQQQQQQHSFPSLSNKQAEIEAQIKADEELAKSLALAMQLEDQDQQRRQQQQAQPTSDNSNSGSGSSDDGPGFQDQIKSKLEVMGKVTKVKFSDLMNGFKRRISGSNNSGSGGDRYSSLEADEATVILPKGERYQVSNSASQQDGNDITHHNYAHTTNGSSSAGKSDRSRQPSDRSMVTVKLSEPNYPRVLSAKNGVSPVNTGKTKLVLPDLIEFGDEEPAAEMLGGNQNSFMATTGSSSTHSTQQLLSGGVATPRAYVQPTIVSPFANGRTSTDFPQQQQSDPTATINDWTLFSSK